MNGMPLINNEEATLTQALKIVAKDKEPKIIIQADSKAPNGLATSVFSAANSLGLKSVSIEVQ